MLTQTVVIFRGTTVQFETTFFDVNCDITVPSSATINIVYPNQTGGGTTTQTVNMNAPTSPATTWTAQWDSRVSGIGTVSWSIHSDPGLPFAVEDGEFILSGNSANLPTFT